MNTNNPKPTGKLMGDSKDMPNKGTGTGITHHGTQAHGASLGRDATNSKGSITGSTKSDSWDESKKSGNNNL